MADVYQPLSDSQWQIITSGDLLPGLHRKRAVDLRLVLEAIWYQCRTGAQWRALPPHYLHWSAVYYYFRRWQQDQTWQRPNTFPRSIPRRCWERSTASKWPPKAACLLASQAGVSASTHPFFYQASTYC